MQFAEELVYSKSISAHGNYKYLRVVPIGSTQNPTLSLTSTIQTQFELPNNVMNLSLSKLCFDLQIPTQTLTKFNNIYGNALALIDRITLTSRSGVMLADIQNTHIFGSLVSSVNTKMQDLLTRNTTSYVLPAGATTDNATPGQDATSQSGALTAAQASPYSDIVRCNHLTNYQVSEKATTALNALTALAYTPYLEPLNLFAAPALAQYNAISYQINLSAFKDTLMELNKNIYFGDNIVLTITWNAFTKMGFTTTAIVANAVLPNAAAFTVAPSISNLFLYTACETDPTIISQLVSSVSNGEFSLIVPFVYCQKYNASASTSSAMQQRLNSSYGSTLLRVYFGVYQNLEETINTYTHNDSFITSYNTYMDGLRLQDYTLTTADSTAWLSNERNFRDSCMLSLKQFKGNFVHIDNWCGASPCQNIDSVLNGLSLDTDRTWSVQTVTPSAAYRYYAFFTTQKKLVISKGSLTLI
jgi:hypothetical protein